LLECRDPIIREGIGAMLAQRTPVNASRQFLLGQLDNLAAQGFAGTGVSMPIRQENWP
jgi:hypothetical protein